ncbi:hypothetical protein LZ554_009051 [Drepanopeziza brunnea f. sp. 'monogermtubi']|nr:hypothetical protein LZ554_009051 [Drepanopeziza brunnea f. sp. 'monogermtubi']
MLDAKSSVPSSSRGYTEVTWGRGHEKTRSTAVSYLYASLNAPNSSATVARRYLGQCEDAIQIIISVVRSLPGPRGNPAPKTWVEGTDGLCRAVLCCYIQHVRVYVDSYISL